MDINAGSTVDIDGSVVRIDGASGAFIDGSLFDDGDATIADDLTVNNDLIVNSVATVGGPEQFTFALNVYSSAGKAGGGLWSVFSDERLKDNIEPMAPTLDRLLALEGRRYTYKDKSHFSYTPGMQRGWIAQQVREVFPEWVGEDDDGYLYISPQGYEIMVVEALRELRTEKDTQLAELQAENQDLRERLERLETLLGQDQ